MRHDVRFVAPEGETAMYDRGPSFRVGRDAVWAYAAVYWRWLAEWQRARRQLALEASGARVLVALTRSGV